MGDFTQNLNFWRLNSEYFWTKAKTSWWLTYVLLYMSIFSIYFNNQVVIISAIFTVLNNFLRFFSRVFPSKAKFRKTGSNELYWVYFLFLHFLLNMSGVHEKKKLLFLAHFSIWIKQIVKLKISINLILIIFGSQIPAELVHHPSCFTNLLLKASRIHFF